MDCEHITSRLNGYLLDELDESESREITDHLECCASCREKTAEEREKIKRNGGLGLLSEIRPQFREELLNAVHTEISLTRKRKRLFSIFLRPALGAAVLLAAAAAGILLISLLDRQSRQNTEPHLPRYTWEHKGISSIEKTSFDAPVLADRRIFALEHNAAGTRFVALDSDTGTLLWHSDEQVTGYAAADPGHLLGVFRPLGGTAVLKCFHAETGKQAWTYDPCGPSPACSAPEITETGLFWSTGRSLHRIDIDTGEPVWSRTFNSKGLLSNPAPAARDSVMITAGTILYELDKKNGETLRSWPLAHTRVSSTNRPLLAASPSAVCAVLFRTPAWTSDLICFSPDDEKVIWRKKTGSVNHVLIQDRSVIVRAGNVSAYSTGPRGTLQWQLKAAGCSPVSVADSRLFFFDMQGKGSLVVVKAENGSVETTYSLPPSCAGITVTGRRGIINAHNGVLYSFAL